MLLRPVQHTAPTQLHSGGMQPQPLQSDAQLILAQHAVVLVCKLPDASAANQDNHVVFRAQTVACAQGMPHQPQQSVPNSCQSQCGLQPGTEYDNGYYGMRVGSVTKTTTIAACMAACKEGHHARVCKAAEIPVSCLQGITA
jgi:hypothetical protein